MRGAGFNGRGTNGKQWSKETGWPPGTRPSEHAYTAALDVMRSLVASQRFGDVEPLKAWDMAQGACQQIADWAVWVATTDPHRETYGWIDNVIWNKRIWTYARRHEGWRRYTGLSDHTDHVHIGLFCPELGEPHP